MKTTYRALILFAVLALLLAATVFLCPFFNGSYESNAPVFAHASMTVRRADGKTFPFNIEVAETLDQERYGLMFRRSLPRDAGMIFIYDPDQPVSMWMKNTYIPLDMLYVRHDGTIVKILTHAQPFDLTPLPSGEPVHAVIEINGGEADELGLKTGDKIIYPGFSG